ncbi:MAG: hypothetical protein AAF253_13245 [Pseudomonadota bacterium]
MAGTLPLNGLLASLFVGLAACQTLPMDDTPARLADTRPETITTLKAGLAKAVGRARITLGPEDLATSTSVSVLPPPPGPHETRSLARPDTFDLVISGTDPETCLAIHRETGSRHPLPTLSCRPAG